MLKNLSRPDTPDNRIGRQALGIDRAGHVSFGIVATRKSLKQSTRNRAE